MHSKAARKGMTLPAVVNRLAERYGATVPYHRIWRDALERAIPAERVGRRMIVYEDDIPAIAAFYGLGKSAA